MEEYKNINKIQEQINTLKQTSKMYEQTYLKQEILQAPKKKIKTRGVIWKKN